VTALAPQIATAGRLAPMEVRGVVASLRGLTLLVDDLPLPVGSLVAVGQAEPGTRAGSIAEVVGFTREHTIVMMLGQSTGLRAGDRVVGIQAAQTVQVGARLLGRVIDGLGRPIDGAGPIRDTVAYPVNPEPLSPLRRRRIHEPIHTGIRAIDLMTTLGRGQRLGVFAGPGVGKSTLLGSIARRSSAHVNVIALIGERGREVGDFLERSLGPEGLSRSVVVVATSDESPLLRVRAAYVACAAAEFFRDRGQDVMLLMDSVTRFAHAQRQIGLAVGEPPATKGYTPSVFANLALLLERAGAVECRSDTVTQWRSDESGSAGCAPAPLRHCTTSGSITGLYAILVEGDDMTEPVADAARGILDGHVILSRRLAQKGHYPAIDVLDSISRVADDVCDPHHVAARRQVVRMLAAFRDVEELVQIGAYARGSGAESDTAIEFAPRIDELLCQERDESEPFDQSRSRMLKVAVESGDSLARRLKEKGR